MNCIKSNIELDVSTVIKTFWYYVAIGGNKKYVIPEETGSMYNIRSMRLSPFRCHIEFIPSMEHRKEIFRIVSEEHESLIEINTITKDATIIRDIYAAYMPESSKIFIYDVKNYKRIDITDHAAEIPLIKSMNSIKYIPKGDRVVMYCDLNE